MRHLLHWAQGLALAVGLLVLPQIASATPVTYFFQAGSVTVSVTTGATNLLTVPSLPLNAGYLVFDSAVPELTDLKMVLNAAGPYALSQPYAGYDTVAVANVQLTPASGFTGPLNLQVAGPPIDNYSINGGPVKTKGKLTVSDSTFTNPTLMSNFNIFQPAAAGTLFVNTVTGNIALIGVTIGVVPATGGEPFPLIIKGDFFFHGLVPEPGTALLLGAGLLGLVAAGRRFRA